MSSAASRTYARALIEAAGSDAATVSHELDQLADLARNEAATWEQLTAPSVPTPALRSTLAAMLDGAHGITRNAVAVLIDNGRFPELPEVAHDFRELVRDAERQLDVHVTSAIELPDQLRDKLQQRLSASTGRTVTLHSSVDESIIGGLIVRHGDTLVDTSLRGRLDQLRLALSRPGGASSASANPHSSSSDSSSSPADA